jgi:hypothetical protein
MSRRDMRLRETSGTELDALAEISPSDAERARERWKTVAPPDMRALADVVEETGQENVS